MVLVVLVGEGKGDVHSGVDADLRPLAGLGPGLQGLHAECDVPAQSVPDQPGAGDPVLLGRFLAHGQVFGPAEANPAHLGDVDHAPAAVHADDVQVPTLRDVHGHRGAEAALVVRLAGAALPAVLPALEVRLQDSLRGLRGQLAEVIEILTPLPYRFVGGGKGALALGEHRPPGVQAVPHRAGRVRLVVQEPDFGSAERQPGTVPELPFHQAEFAHNDHHTQLVYVTALEPVHGRGAGRAGEPGPTAPVRRSLEDPAAGQGVGGPPVTGSGRPRCSGSRGRDCPDRRSA